ncbi:uncharacterized protein LOC118437116 [Folsomia candida]|uniref:uncharacterized protein LOC118437116 n=1 Tax=Folsomia candida TaxID=158441 RepID=UPI001604B705|nr:uncharacterized protein LOC118437116 [Folsomia candida]
MSSSRSQRRRVKNQVDLILAEIDSAENQDLKLNIPVIDSVPKLVEEPRDSSSSEPVVYLSETISPNITVTPNIITDILEPEDKPKFKNSLAAWAIKHNITAKAVDDLLFLLKQNNSDLDVPLCSKTLLSTPGTKDYKVTRVQGGFYHHFGLGKMLQNFHAHNLISSSSNTLKLIIGIDGLPISESSKKQFWPILGSCESVNRSRPFLIGLYFSEQSKPGCFQEFLTPLILEMEEFQKHGLWLGYSLYNIVIFAIIADAPARNSLKFTVTFNAYHGCERCIDKGKWLGRIIYTKLDSPLRTDEDFFKQTDKRHHTGVSPFADLGIGLVTGVPLDYMHLICLGIVKKLIKCWKKGPRVHRLGRVAIERISFRLENRRKFTPKEFNRKPRGLADLEYWKATEFRAFLLYLGPVVLKGVLQNEKYTHFLYLSLALRILLSDNKEWYGYAKFLLVEFVKNVPKLYSSEFLVYNVHSLIHIVDDALKFGSLENVNAFKFENYMQKLKKMLRGRHSQLAQVIRRITESDKFGFRPNEPLKCHHWIISNNLGNRCFILENGDVIIVNSVEDESVVVKKIYVQC